METIKRRALGIAVLVALVWFMYAAATTRFPGDMLPCGIFAALLGAWVVRAVVRFMGRAWRHGAKAH